MDQKLMFDQDAWNHSNLEVRGHMVQCLLDSGFLVGKRKSEVYEILGYPDDSLDGDFWYWYINKNFVSQPWPELLFFEIADSTGTVLSLSLRD
jgi:hypothetical protein